MAVGNPNYAPVANNFFIVSVAVASKASAQAAGVGPFRGLFFIASSSVTIVNENGNSMSLDNVAKNVMLWLQADYVSVIATATSVFAVI